MIDIPILAAMFAALNRVRGSRLDQLGVPIKGNGAFIAGLGMAAMAWWFSQSWIAAAAVGGAYAFGELWGWTRWIHGVTCKFTQENFVKKFANDDTTLAGLADKIAPMRDDYINHCFVGFMLRGLLWWVPVFTALSLFGMVQWYEAIAATVVLSVALPFTYRLAYMHQFVGKYLRTAEVCYGGLYGAALGVCL